MRGQNQLCLWMITLQVGKTLKPSSSAAYRYLQKPWNSRLVLSLQQAMDCSLPTKANKSIKRVDLHRTLIMDRILSLHVFTGSCHLGIPLLLWNPLLLWTISMEITIQKGILF